MELLKSQFNRIQQQLAGLTISQKMLTGTLVAIMIVTLLWWARYAGTPAMEVVASKAMTSDELVRAQQVLASKGIPTETASDGRLMVPSEQRVMAIATLAYENVLPQDNSDVMEEMINKINPFASQSTNEQMWNIAPQMSLSQLIRKMPNVANATGELGN